MIEELGSTRGNLSMHETELAVALITTVTKKRYTKPVLQKLDVANGTKSGSPNQSFDGGSFFDFFGPNS